MTHDKFLTHSMDIFLKEVAPYIATYKFSKFNSAYKLLKFGNYTFCYKIKSNVLATLVLCEFW